jgi:predicted O-methyltransferase YrrM
MSCAPDTGRLLTGDAMEVISNGGSFDLIFADAEGGKWEGLDTTVAALRPGAHLPVDDMTPGEFADDHHARKTSEVRARLLDHPDLTSLHPGAARLQARQAAGDDELTNSKLSHSRSFTSCSAGRTKARG